jgi:signal transduction histidine kinase
MASRNGYAKVEQSRSPEALTESEQRFRDLALAALEKEQVERGKLARLLHDEVAPILSGAGLQLDILRMDLEDRVSGVSSRTAEIQDLLERVVRHIRDVSYDLNPDVVKRTGLQPALNLLLSHFQRVFPGSLRLSYDHSIHIPVEAEVALERVAKEAVANAVRHSHCTQIEILVKSAGAGAKLQVRDNGIGFDYDRELRVPRGLGLLMMDFCSRNSGLHLSIDGNVVGGGSMVTAILMNRKSPGG